MIKYRIVINIVFGNSKIENYGVYFNKNKTIINILEAPIKMNNSKPGKSLIDLS